MITDCFTKFKSYFCDVTSRHNRIGLLYFGAHSSKKLYPHLDSDGEVVFVTLKFYGVGLLTPYHRHASFNTINKNF